MNKGKMMNGKQVLGYALRKCREGLLENIMNNMNFPFDKIPVQELIEEVSEVGDSAEYWHFTSRTGNVKNLRIELAVNVDVNHNEVEAKFIIVDYSNTSYGETLAELNMTFGLQKTNWNIKPVYDKRDVYCFFWFRNGVKEKEFTFFE